MTNKRHSSSLKYSQHSNNRMLVRSVRERRSVSLALKISTFIIINSLILSAISATGFLDQYPSSSMDGILKFWPLLSMFFAVLFPILLLTPKRVIPNAVATLGVNKYFTAFVLVALPGAVYSRFIIDRPTSYFSQAIMPLAFFCAFFVFESTPEKYWIRFRVWLVRAFGLLAIIAIVAVLYNLSNNFHKTTHEAVLLLTQGIALVFYRNSKPYKIVLLICLTGITLLTFKNTAILTLPILFLGFYLFPKNFLRKYTFSNFIGIVLLIAVVIGVVAGAYVLMQARFSGYSDGNIPFRTILYKYRFDQFLSSPLYGQLFMGETAYQFESLFSGANVPTHSDWLDVLAQGGVVGFLLFAGGFIRTCHLLIKTRHRNIKLDRATSNIASWQLLFIIIAMFSFALNPFLNAPDIALIFWVAIAFAHRISRPLRLSQTNVVHTGVHSLKIYSE